MQLFSVVLEFINFCYMNSQELMALCCRHFPSSRDFQHILKLPWKQYALRHIIKFYISELVCTLWVFSFSYSSYLREHALVTKQFGHNLIFFIHSNLKWPFCSNSFLKQMWIDEFSAIPFHSPPPPNAHTHWRNILQILIGYLLVKSIRNWNGHYWTTLEPSKSLLKWTKTCWSQWIMGNLVWGGKLPEIKTKCYIVFSTSIGFCRLLCSVLVT